MTRGRGLLRAKDRHQIKMCWADRGVSTVQVNFNNPERFGLEYKARMERAPA